jgi:hypothetical protein
MALDLTLVPQFAYYTGRSDFLAYNRLALDRQCLLFDEIAAVAKIYAERIPASIEFLWYDDGGIKERTTDPYGTSLTWIRAEDLTKVNLTDSVTQ